MFLEAVAAVNRATFGRLEWDLRLGATVGAGGVVHFAGTAGGSASFFIHTNHWVPRRSETKSPMTSFDKAEGLLLMMLA